MDDIVVSGLRDVVMEVVFAVVMLQVDVILTTAELVVVHVL